MYAERQSAFVQNIKHADRTFLNINEIVFFPGLQLRFYLTFADCVGTQGKCERLFFRIVRKISVIFVVIAQDKAETFAAFESKTSRYHVTFSAVRKLIPLFSRKAHRRRAEQFVFIAEISVQTVDGKQCNRIVFIKLHFMCDKMSSPIQIGIVAESRSAVNPTDEEGPLVALNDFRRIKMFTLQPLRFAVTRKLFIGYGIPHRIFRLSRIREKIFSVLFGDIRTFEIPKSVFGIGEHHAFVRNGLQIERNGIFYDQRRALGVGFHGHIENFSFRIVINLRITEIDLTVFRGRSDLKTRYLDKIFHVSFTLRDHYFFPYF